MPSLDRYLVEGVTLLADTSVRGGVTFAFTERTGGVSRAPYASLNLGSRCGDLPEAVSENRARVLKALGAGALAERLVMPHQVHGDKVVVVADSEGEGLLAARSAAEAGCDAIVCTAPGVPVMLCFADCVPVVVCAPGGFAVAHSGWRGTMEHIAAKATCALMEATGAAPRELAAYVGPHIGAADYEVSAELLAKFVDEFGPCVVAGENRLDLATAVLCALAEAGLDADQVAVCQDSTASNTDRFFSYRAEHGSCGRHAAVAWMSADGTCALVGADHAPSLEGRK